MVDMCLCSGIGCDKATSCFRARAVGCEYRQSQFLGLPKNKDGTCNYYIDLKDYGSGYELKPIEGVEDEGE